MTHAPWQSAFVAAVFALHPLHVESVAWVSERKDLLSTFFSLLTCFAYLHYTRKQKTGTYVLCLFLYALALASKPMPVTLPLVLLLLRLLAALPGSRLCPGKRHALGFFSVH